jgi:glutamate/tyrosine decarboxylase-like PLP-dependent enzyme
MALTRRSKKGHPRRPLAAPIHQASGDAHSPSVQLPEQGLGEQLSYELLTNELLLDGQARLNLATFVTTWMPSIAGRLMNETSGTPTKPSRPPAARRPAPAKPRCWPASP